MKCRNVSPSTRLGPPGRGGYSDLVVTSLESQGNGPCALSAFAWSEISCATSAASFGMSEMMAAAAGIVSLRIKVRPGGAQRRRMRVPTRS